MPSLPKQPEGDAIAWSETPGAMQPVDAREVLQPRTTASKDNNTSLTLLQRLRRATVVILVALALPHGPSQAAPPELLVAVPVIHNPLSPNGEFIAGVRAYIGRVNTEGGVNGVPVRVVEVEQADIDTQFAQNLARILRSVPVAAILGCATAPACLVAKRMAQEHQLPLIAPLSSLPELTTGGAGTVFSLRAPLQDEVRALVNQLVQIGFANVALVTEGPSVSAVDVALLDELRLRGIRATTIPAGSASDYAALPGHLAASSFHAAIVNVPPRRWKR